MKIVDGYSFFFLCLLELVIPEKKKKTWRSPWKFTNRASVLWFFVCMFFFGEGIISLREDGRGYENPGFGCLPGMKLHFTCFSSLGLAVL